ncbi:hypothetical protein, partial [Streptomyces capuensis]|uniref:hypothetical protein n=1 Tax=Streptomyces capuensis TaxID=1464056 RepID=UPI000518CD58
MSGQHSPRGATPVELYGPQDGGWYTTRVHDWIPLCPALKDGDVRCYQILRSLILEKYKNPVRKLSLATLCQLIPGPSDTGTSTDKGSSLTRVRGMLAALSSVGLISTPEGQPVRTSSRPTAAQKTIRIRVNDMPHEGYLGWRNTEDKLAAILAAQEAQQAAEEAGRKSDPEPEETPDGEG